MRRFMVHLVTEIDFEGDEASDETVQNYKRRDILLIERFRICQ